MGNRAHVIFQEGSTISPAIYLHWNGGTESVYAFLAELDRREVRPDAIYDAARFVQIVGEFFDSSYFTGLSLGISNGPKTISEHTLQHFDHGDNGAFIVTRSQKLVRRYAAGRFLPDAEVAAEYRMAVQEKTYNGIREFFEAIDKPTESKALASA